MTSLIYPKANAAALRRSGGFAVLGALLAGIYGALHDQITYTISPEYFTRFKFLQSRAADFGFPPRVLAAEIGFLASWWVGLIGGWFLARIATQDHPDLAGRRLARAAAFIAAVSAGSAVLAAVCAPIFFRGEVWSGALADLGVTRGDAFSRVAAIHWGSYLGAFGGWVTLLVLWWRQARRRRQAAVFLIDGKSL